MANGIVCYDNNGGITFNSSINTTRILGSFNTGQTNGNINIPALASGTPWFVENYTENNMDMSQKYTIIMHPTLTINGTIISWSFPSYPPGLGIFNDYQGSVYYYKASMNIIYGVM